MQCTIDDLIYEDVPAMIAAIQRIHATQNGRQLPTEYTQHNAVKITLMGHSLGAIVASLFPGTDINRSTRSTAIGSMQKAKPPIDETDIVFYPGSVVKSIALCPPLSFGYNEDTLPTISGITDGDTSKKDKIGIAIRRLRLGALNSSQMILALFGGNSISSTGSGDVMRGPTSSHVLLHYMATLQGNMRDWFYGSDKKRSSFRPVTPSFYTGEDLLENVLGKTTVPVYVMLSRGDTMAVYSVQEKVINLLANANVIRVDFDGKLGHEKVITEGIMNNANNVRDTITEYITK